MNKTRQLLVRYLPFSSYYCCIRSRLIGLLYNNLDLYVVVVHHKNNMSYVQTSTQPITTYAKKEKRNRLES